MFLKLHLNGTTEEFFICLPDFKNDNWIPLPNEEGEEPGFDIIQPVLQYGATPDGGGASWGLASWYVTLDENVLASPLQTVNPGDNIFGNMTRINETAWFIGGHDTTQDIESNIVVDDPRLYTQPWAYCTLEVYNIADCSNDFPPSSSPIKFTNLELYSMGKQVTPSWQALNNQADHCGATVTAPNPSSVTITF